MIPYNFRTAIMRFMKIDLIFICFTVMVFVYYTFQVHRHIYITVSKNDSIPCTRIDTLDPIEVPVNKSIFFIESTRANAVELTPRQACSVESAARVHPDRLVYVLLLGTKFKCQNDKTTISALLSNYPNIRLRHIDLQTYTNNTPFQDFVQSGTMENGSWPVEQHSDMLRILTLWKFGGIYLDLDVVTLKEIPLINFIGSEYPGDYLASCAIGMQSKRVAARAIEMFIEGWNGTSWGQNGPILLTNLMKEQCGVYYVKDMYSNDCNNFTIYREHVFGPIPWYERGALFNLSKVKYVKDLMNSSMGIHYWNKLTKEQLIFPKSGQPAAIIADENCPKVYKTVVDHF